MTEQAAGQTWFARLTRVLTGERRQLALFIAVGVVNTAVGYALFALLFLILQSYRIAAVLAFIGGVAFNFFSTGRLVFNSRRGSALIPFVAGYLAVLGLNLVLLEVLVRFGVKALIAQAISLPPLVVASYLINSRMVFRRRCE